MPRLTRVRSDSGIYHVMLRGINKQRIFHEPVDYQCLCEDEAMTEQRIRRKLLWLSLYKFTSHDNPQLLTYERTPDTASSGAQRRRFHR